MSFETRSEESDRQPGQWEVGTHSTSTRTGIIIGNPLILANPPDWVNFETESFS